MPFTTSLSEEEVKHFFEVELGIHSDTVSRLAEEGIERPEDLIEFNSENVKTIVGNLRRPGGTVPEGRTGRTVPTQPFKFGAKAVLRLENAIDIMKYYETLDFQVTADMLVYEPTIKNFKMEHNALVERKSMTVITPKTSTNLDVVKWTEAFLDLLSRSVGARNTPLIYVVRIEIEVDNDAPLHLPEGQCYTAKSGSIEQELITRASHSHPMFKEDNAKVYYLLEEATRGTTYSASIKPYQKRKNGRDAWFSLKDQYAGVDKWKRELERQEDFINNRKWKGNSNYPLANHVSGHRNAYISLVACSDHIDYQLPNGLTRVRKLVRSIECSDPKLLATIAQAESDKTMKSDFEATASFILPSDPVANNKATTPNKNDGGIMSDANAKVSSVGGRDGSTGVDLRFHKREEHRTLSKEKKATLRKWRTGNPEAFEKSKRKALGPDNQHNSNKRQKTGHDKRGTSLTAQIQSVVDKKLNTLKEKKVTIEDPNANASKWFKDSMKKHTQENGGNVGSLETIASRMQSDLDSAPQGILRTINNYKASKPQE